MTGSSLGRNGGIRLALLLSLAPTATGGLSRRIIGEFDHEGAVTTSRLEVADNVERDHVHVSYK